MKRTPAETERRSRLEKEIDYEVKDMLSLEGVGSLNLDEIHQELNKRGYKIEPAHLKEWLDYQNNFPDSQIREVDKKYTVY